MGTLDGDLNSAATRKQQPRDTGGLTAGGVDNAIRSLNPVGMAINAPVQALAQGVQIATAPAADALKSAVYGAAGYQPADATQYTDQAGNAFSNTVNTLADAVQKPLTKAIAAQPDAVKVQQDAAVTPGQQTNQPLADNSYGQADRGAGTSSPSDQPAQSVQVPTAPQPLATAPAIAPAPQGSDANPGAYHQQYLAMQANEAADAQAARTRAQSFYNQADQRIALQTTNRNAQVANFLAKNGVFSGTAGQQAQARAVQVAEAGKLNGDVETGTAAYNKARSDYETAGNRDFIGDMSRTNQAIATGLQGQAEAQTLPYKIASLNQALQKGGVDLAIQQLGLQNTQEQRAQLATLQKETDPAKRRLLMQNLLTAQGKEEKAPQYQFIHVKGGTDPNNPLATLPDELHRVNPETGESVKVSGGAQASGKLPEGVDPDAARANAQKLVAAGKMTKDAANAQLSGYGLKPL